MNASSQTRLAILGTMSDLHRQPIRYDLHCLREIVADLSPDFLCVEITIEAWERGDLSQAAVEVPEALAPIAASTDIVLIPVAPTPDQYGDFTPRTGLRRRLIKALSRLLRWGQIKADSAPAVNGFWFGAFCHTVCWLTEVFWVREDRDAWERQNRDLVENIVQASQRDRGRRVLVAVQCQRLHHLNRLLRTHADLFEIVPYERL